LVTIRDVARRARVSTATVSRALNNTGTVRPEIRERVRQALAAEARTALNFTLYSIDDQGRPRDLAKHAAPGGWQEDAHTDVIHNYVDALRAFPAWGRSVR
jgi:DNA-binding MurR/RpiR family transcriptional regulator